MKRFSRITKKSVSILLAIAMLMSVCIVGLTTLVSAYTHGGSTTTDVKTYYYDFYSDTYSAYHSYAWNDLYWSADGQSAVSVQGKDGGLHVTTSQLLWVTTGGTSRIAYTTNVYVKDADNGLAGWAGIPKFEPGTDYGIVVKYKINNLAELQAELAKEGSTQSDKVCVALSSAKGLSNGAVFKKGNNDAIDIIDLNNYNNTTDASTFAQNGVIVEDDGWRYMCFEVDGDNPSWHSSNTNTTTQTLALTSWVYGGSTTGLTTIPVEIVYESVTITVADCAADHITTEGATNTINTDLMLAKQVETDGSYAYKYIQKGAALSDGYYCGEFTTMADDNGYYNVVNTTAPVGTTYKWRETPSGYWQGGNASYFTTFDNANTFVDAEGLHFYSNKFFKNAAGTTCDKAVVFDRNFPSDGSAFATIKNGNNYRITMKYKVTSIGDGVTRANIGLGYSYSGNNPIGFATHTEVSSDWETLVVYLYDGKLVRQDDLYIYFGSNVDGGEVEYLVESVVIETNPADMPAATPDESPELNENTLLYKWADSNAHSGYWAGNASYVSTIASDLTYMNVEGLHFGTTKALANEAGKWDFGVVFDRAHHFASLSNENDYKLTMKYKVLSKGATNANIGFGYTSAGNYTPISFAEHKAVSTGWETMEVYIAKEDVVNGNLYILFGSAAAGEEAAFVVDWVTVETNPEMPAPPNLNDLYYQWRETPSGYWQGNNAFISTHGTASTYVDAEGLHIGSSKLFKNVAKTTTGDFAVVFDRNHQTAESTFASVKNGNNYRITMKYKVTGMADGVARANIALGYSYGGGKKTIGFAAHTAVSSDWETLECYLYEGTVDTQKDLYIYFGSSVADGEVTFLVESVRIEINPEDMPEKPAGERELPELGDNTLLYKWAEPDGTYWQGNSSYISTLDTSDLTYTDAKGLHFASTKLLENSTSIKWDFAIVFERAHHFAALSSENNYKLTMKYKAVGKGASNANIALATLKAGSYTPVGFASHTEVSADWETMVVYIAKEDVVDSNLYILVGSAVEGDEAAFLIDWVTVETNPEMPEPEPEPDPEPEPEPDPEPEDPTLPELNENTLLYKWRETTGYWYGNSDLVTNHDPVNKVMSYIDAEGIHLYSTYLLENRTDYWNKALIFDRNNGRVNLSSENDYKITMQYKVISKSENTQSANIGIGYQSGAQYIPAGFAAHTAVSEDWETMTIFIRKDEVVSSNDLYIIFGASKAGEEVSFLVNWVTVETNPADMPEPEADVTVKEFTFADEAAQTLYSGYGHNTFSNSANGVGSGIIVGLGAKLVGTGLVPSWDAVVGAGDWGYYHKMVILDNDVTGYGNEGYANGIQIKAGYKYTIDVEYIPYEINSEYTSFIAVVLNASQSETLSNVQYMPVGKYEQWANVDNTAITSAEQVEKWERLILDIDGDATYGELEETKKAAAGKFISIAAREGSYIINKVTVYITKKEAAEMNSSYVMINGGELQLVENGQRLVTDHKKFLNPETGEIVDTWASGYIICSGWANGFGQKITKITESGEVNYYFDTTNEVFKTPNAEVKSSLRKESGSGEEYLSAGLRYRARVENPELYSHIGFAILPEQYAAADAEWYMLNANGKKASEISDTKIVWAKTSKGHVVYTEGDGYNDYQICLTDLTAEGEDKNLKGVKFSAVLILKDAETGEYYYQFVRSVSYNEIKQVYINAGITGAEDY